MKGFEELQTILDYACEYVDERDNEFDKRQFEESSQVISEILKAFNLIADKIRLGSQKINDLCLYYLAFDLIPNKEHKDKVFITKEQYEELLKLGIKEIKDK